VNLTDFFPADVVFENQNLNRKSSAFGEPPERSHFNKMTPSKTVFSGITPFASYVRSAMIRKLESRIYFVWIAPRMDCFEWFDDLLRQAEAKVPFLRVMIFLTLSNMDPATAQVRKNILNSRFAFCFRNFGTF